MAKEHRTELVLARAEAFDDAELSFTVPARSTWLPEPGNSPAGRGEVESWIRGFHQGVVTLETLRRGFDATAGQVVHAIGTYLLEMHGHSAWKVLELPDFEALCEQRLNVSRRTGERLMFVARVATEAQAAYGIRKCIAGHTLATGLGAHGLGALLPHGEGWSEPAAWAERLGEPVNFVNSSAARLERLAARLSSPLPPASEPSKRVKALVVERRRSIARVVERHPALGALRVKSFARGGEARVSHDAASSTEEMAALAAMYAALARA